MERNMIVSGWALFVKDKDGFEQPLYEYGNIMVYPNEHQATSAKTKKLGEINDILEPRIDINSRKNLFGFKVNTEKPPALSEGVRRELIQQRNTLFVRQVKFA